MKKIAVEEHWIEKGTDSIENRLNGMDESGIDMQVLSCIFPNDTSLDAAEATRRSRNINNALAKLVEEYPGRFRAFAALALQDPVSAADELERAVNELGLKGPMIFSNIGGEYLDNEKFHVLLERAQGLDVPIYLHPVHPSAAMIEPFMAYPLLSGSMWGFSVESSLHAMRLICSGTFDRFPDLQVILGHLGEAIPFWLWRIDNRWMKEKDGGPKTMNPDPITSKLVKKPSQYFRDNFYVTTSGMFWPPVLQFVNNVLGADRILFAVDYDQEQSAEAVDFIEAVPLNEEEKEKICHINAERLLKI